MICVIVPMRGGAARNHAGLTIVEMLLVIALLGILGGISIPLYHTFQVRNDLDIIATAYTHALRRAQTLARGVDGDTSWGVRITATTIVLFRGVSFALRDSAFDETYDIPAQITASGMQEVVFAKFTGLPQTTGTTTFTTNTLESRDIVLNSKGMVRY